MYGLVQSLKPSRFISWVSQKVLRKHHIPSVIETQAHRDRSKAIKLLYRFDNGVNGREKAEVLELVSAIWQINVEEKVVRNVYTQAHYDKFKALEMIKDLNVYEDGEYIGIVLRFMEAVWRRKYE